MRIRHINKVCGYDVYYSYMCVYYAHIVLKILKKISRLWSLQSPRIWGKAFPILSIHEWGDDHFSYGNSHWILSFAWFEVPVVTRLHSVGIPRFAAFPKSKSWSSHQWHGMESFIQSYAKMDRMSNVQIRCLIQIRKSKVRINGGCHFWSCHLKLSQCRCHGLEP